MKYFISSSILEFKSLAKFIGNDPYYVWDVSNTYSYIKCYCFIKANCRVDAIKVCLELIENNYVKGSYRKNKNGNGYSIFQLTKGK